MKPSRCQRSAFLLFRGTAKQPESHQTSKCDAKKSAGGLQSPRPTQLKYISDMFFSPRACRPDPCPGSPGSNGARRGPPPQVYTCPRTHSESPNKQAQIKVKVAHNRPLYREVLRLASYSPVSSADGSERSHKRNRDSLVGRCGKCCPEELQPSTDL